MASCTPPTTHLSSPGRASATILRRIVAEALARDDGGSGGAGGRVGDTRVAGCGAVPRPTVDRGTSGMPAARAGTCHRAGADFPQRHRTGPSSRRTGPSPRPTLLGGPDAPCHRRPLLRPASPRRPRLARTPTSRARLRGRRPGADRPRRVPRRLARAPQPAPGPADHRSRPALPPRTGSPAPAAQAEPSVAAPATATGHQAHGSRTADHVPGRAPPVRPPRSRDPARAPPRPRLRDRHPEPGEGPGRRDGLRGPRTPGPTGRARRLRLHLPRAASAAPGPTLRHTAEPRPRGSGRARGARRAR